MKLRARIMKLLHDESELEEIVKLVGMDALSAPDRLKLEAARSIREDFLHQDAFHEVDTYTPLEKQFRMMELVLNYFDAAAEALERGAAVNGLVKLEVREKIGRFKYIPNDGTEKEFQEIMDSLHREIDGLLAKEDA
ncbi:V-type sodium ATPase catalytic subunit A [bioreactor metagenome]|uniref:V-type sodium ATPase catalytic subunit A n=1 Tax=bioreactor metagenome TaxID=1076179 RepID=A0A645JPT9_9ZZZZ